MVLHLERLPRLLDIVKLNLVPVSPDPYPLAALCVVQVEAEQVVQIPGTVCIDDVQVHAWGKAEVVCQVEQGSQRQQDECVQLMSAGPSRRARARAVSWSLTSSEASVSSRRASSSLYPPIGTMRYATSSCWNSDARMRVANSPS